MLVRRLQRVFARRQVETERAADVTAVTARKKNRLIRFFTGECLGGHDIGIVRNGYCFVGNATFRRATGDLPASLCVAPLIGGGFASHRQCVANRLRKLLRDLGIEIVIHRCGSHDDNKDYEQLSHDRVAR